MSYCRFENTARDLRDCVEAINNNETENLNNYDCLLYTSPSPRDEKVSRMPSSA